MATLPTLPLTVPALATGPTPNPIVGQMYMDVTTNRFVVYDGAKWVELQSIPSEWRLFLDDERTPASIQWPDSTDVARSSTEAQEMIRQYGLPIWLSLDHDLGGDDTGFKFMWWLIDNHFREKLDLRMIQLIQVHTANPIGAEKMIGLWENFAREAGIDTPISRVRAVEP